MREFLLDEDFIRDVYVEEYKSFSTSDVIPEKYKDFLADLFWSNILSVMICFLHLGNIYTLRVILKSNEIGSMGMLF